jgi:hypothetical protein
MGGGGGRGEAQTEARRYMLRSIRVPPFTYILSVTNPTAYKP